MVFPWDDGRVRRDWSESARDERGGWCESLGLATTDGVWGTVWGCALNVEAEVSQLTENSSELFRWVFCQLVHRPYATVAGNQPHIPSN